MLAAFWQRLRYALRTHKMLLLALLAGLVLPWVVFVNVAEDIWESGGFIGDKRILEFLHAHATPGLDKLALGLTAAGDPLPMGVLLNLLVKVGFARPRPALWLSLKPAFYYSFPSGHAMGAAALGFLLWQHRGRWPALVLGPLFALGVHYPSDVLAGWTGSVGWVAGLHMLFSPEFHQLRQLWREALHRRLPTLVSPPRNAQRISA